MSSVPARDQFPADIVTVGLTDEDNEMARRVLHQYRVHPAGTIRQLRALVKDISPLAVISEIWLRDGHCLEVQEALMDRNAATQIVLVASALETDLSTLHLEEHPFWVLQKPLRAVELASTVEQCRRVSSLAAKVMELEAAVQSLRVQSEEASRLKTEFISLISHELRTPLTEVIGYSELLAAGDAAPGNVEEFARRIVRSASQLKTLIDDLLLLSKAEAGALPLEVSTFPVETLVHGRVGEMLKEAQAKGFTIETAVDSKMGLLSADSAKLSKVLQNLISNAVKFSPPGGRIGVEVSDAGPAVLISVSDQGKGIPPERLRELFLAFRQEDSSDRRSYGGLGIGLSIVKHFVELHGGSVRVTSRPDRGSVFSLVIPRRPAKAQGTPRRGGRP